MYSMLVIMRPASFEGSDKMDIRIKSPILTTKAPGMGGTGCHVRVGL